MRLPLQRALTEHIMAVSSKLKENFTVDHNYFHFIALDRKKKLTHTHFRMIHLLFCLDMCTKCSAHDPCTYLLSLIRLLAAIKFTNNADRNSNLFLFFSVCVFFSQPSFFIRRKSAAMLLIKRAANNERNLP